MVTQWKVLLKKKKAIFFILFVMDVGSYLAAR